MKNIALNKTTIQSSTWKNYSYANASNAVDGSRKSNWYKHSCSHTKGSNSPWWRVDAGNVVRYLQIYMLTVYIILKNVKIY